MFLFMDEVKKYENYEQIKTAIINMIKYDKLFSFHGKHLIIDMGKNKK